MSTLKKLTALAAAIAFAASIGATTLTVDASGSGDYFTITEALQYAMPGDHIAVNGGIYNTASGETFPISVPTDITIAGTQDDRPVIMAPANRTAMEIRDEARVTIRNLVIRDAETGIAILNDATDVTLERVFIRTCRKTGIMLKNAENVKINAVIIADALSAIEAVKSERISVNQSTLAGPAGAGKSVAVSLFKTGIDLQRSIIDGFANGITVEKTDLAAVTLTNNSIHDCAVPFRHDKTGIRTFTSPDSRRNRDEAPCFVNRSSGDLRLNKDSRLTGLGAYPVNVMPANCAIPQGTMQYDAIQLSWSTQSEQSNKGWNIYRGFSSEGPFEKVNDNLILGAGTVQSSRSYTFYDEDLPAMSDDIYYYLEQVSADGNTTFTQTVNVPTRTSVTAVAEDVFTD